MGLEWLDYHNQTNFPELLDLQMAGNAGENFLEYNAGI